MSRTSTIDPLSARLLRNAGGHGPIALMYHSVTPGAATPDWQWAVSHRAFLDQLELLHDHGWRTACLRDLVDGRALAPRTVVITFDDGYADNHPAFEALAARQMCASWFIVSGTVDRSSDWRDPGVPAMPMLSRAQLHEMADHGMEIGAHGRRHLRLTELDDARLADEVAGSRAELQAVMDGRPVESFAYPYGIHDARVVEAVRRAGYKAACITRSGWIANSADALRLRRTSVFAHDDLASFARKLAFADNDVRWGRLLRYGLGRLRARLLPGTKR